MHLKNEIFVIEIKINGIHIDYLNNVWNIKSSIIIAWNIVWCFENVSRKIRRINCLRKAVEEYM